ncbi:MAG: KH domain-containing protein [Candidatus Saccharimonadales bacterium]
MSTSIDEQFIEFIVKSLVGKPDAVKIERRIDEKGVLLELTVDPEDLGRVIGKRGATAQSLRTLLRALGTKNDARYNLKIVDNGEPHERRPRPEESDDAAEDKPAKAKPKADKEEPIDEEPAEEASIDAEPEDEDDHSSLASKTRKELEDLDDLEL